MAKSHLRSFAMPFFISSLLYTIFADLRSFLESKKRALRPPLPYALFYNPVGSDALCHSRNIGDKSSGYAGLLYFVYNSTVPGTHPRRGFDIRSHKPSADGFHIPPQQLHLPAFRRKFPQRRQISHWSISKLNLKFWVSKWTLRLSAPISLSSSSCSFQPNAFSVRISIPSGAASLQA